MASAVKSMRGTRNELPEERFGLHPFDKLCYVCPAKECDTSKWPCLQKQVIISSEKKKMKLNHVCSWRQKNELMVQAGLSCLLGSLVELYDLSDMIKLYPQISEEEMLIEDVDKVKFKD